MHDPEMSETNNKKYTNSNVSKLSIFANFHKKISYKALNIFSNGHSIVAWVLITII